MTAAGPTTWPEQGGRNWSLSAGIPRWYHWRGRGSSPEDALARSRRDAQRVMTVLTNGRGILPDLPPLARGTLTDGAGDPPWATSFAGGDCDINIGAPMLEAARAHAASRPEPAARGRWWQWRRNAAAEPDPGPAWSQEDVAGAAQALMRICAERLLTEGGDRLDLWIGSDAATADALSLYLCPFVATSRTHRGHAPLPEPYRAAMAAIATAHATTREPRFAQMGETLPASASARATWRGRLDAREDAATLAAFLRKAGLPEDAEALLAAEAAGWAPGNLG